MSKFVDERVVEMSFDNKHFEKNVKTSMSTIDKLKNSLDFSGTANSINKEFDSISTGGLSSAIMSAKSSFTAFEVATIAAIANITNRVIDLGIQMVKSLSTDNIGAGWQKFGQSAISEATLLAQGFEQADVTETLEKLLWYSDETSYSFTDMVDNMSKFTASGQGLEESSRAMMGIANWAALSGQNAGTASRAMYQLSQAMAAGSVRLMDYKSIQNANMDTKEFRETVLATAVAMGELTQNVDGTYTTMTGKTFNTGQFTTELDELWFTSEVLMSSLDKYSSGAEKLYQKIGEDSEINTASQAMDKYGDYLDDFELKAFLAAQEARTFKDAIVAIQDAVSSGWLNVFTQIFGSVAEAKVLWTDFANSLYDVFMDGMWKKIDVLSIWAENNGRDDLFANTEENTGAFWNLFNAIVAIKDLIGGSWQKVFGFSDLEEYDDQVQDIATKLKTLTENLKEWSEGLFLSQEATETLTNIFTGLFSVLKIVGQTIIAVYKGVTPLLELLKPLLSYVLGALGLVGKEITQFSETTTVFERITDTLQRLSYGIIDFVKSLKLLEGIKIVIDSFKKSLNDVLGDTDTNVVSVNLFKKVIDALSSAFKWFGSIITTYIIPYLPKLFELLGRGLGLIVGSIINFGIYVGELITRFREWVKTNVTFQNGILKLKNVLSVIGNAFKTLVNNIKEFFSSFDKDNMKHVGKFSGNLEREFTPLKTFIEGLSNLFKGLWNLLQAVIPAIGALFTFVGKALSYIGDKLKELFTTGDGDINFKRIFTVGFWSVVAVGIYRFADMLRSITEVFRDAFDGMFDYFNSKAMKSYMEAIKTMAISILLMVGALLILGSMDESALKKSLIAMTALVGFIVGTMILMKNLLEGTTVTLKKGGLLKGAKRIKETHMNLAGLAAAFIGLGIAILLLATSLKMINKMNPDEMMRSLGIIAIMMAMMVSVMKVVGKSEKGVNKAVKSMVKVAISVALLARPLRIIGSIDTETGIKGLIGIAALMTILVLYSQFSKSIDKSQKPVYGLISTAIALTMLIVPLKVIGGMDIETLIKAGTSILGLFVIFAAMGKIVSVEDSMKLKDITKSLIGVAFALGLFGGAMLVVGLNDWGSMGKSAASIVGVFTIMMFMNKVLGKQLTKPRVTNMANTIKSLKGVAVALAMLGASMLIVGLNNWNSIGKTIATLIGVLGTLVVMNKVLGKQLTKPRVRNMSKIIWMLIPLSVALSSFGISMLIVGSVPWDKIVKSLVAIGSIIAVLVLVDKALKASGTSAMSMLTLSGALILLGGAMLVLSLGLLALGSIPIKTMAIALGALAATLVVLGLAAWALMATGTTAALLALSVTMVIFSGAVFLLAAALTMFVGVMAVSSAAFAAGLIAMSAALVVAAPMMMKALWALIEGILQVVIKSIPLLVEALKTLVIEVLGAIDSLVEPLMNTIETLLTGLLGTINTMMPMIVETLVNLLDKLLDGITTIFPKILTTLVNLIMQLLDALVVNVPIFVDKLVDMFIGLVQKLRERAPEVMMEMGLYIADLVDGAVAALVMLIPRMVNAGFDLIIGLLDGIGNAIVERAPELREAINRFCQNIWDAILLFFGINSPSTKMMEVAGNLISGLLKGLWDGLGNLLSSIGQWAGQVLGSIKNVFNQAWSMGKDLINNIGNGAKNVWNSTKSWFSGAASDVGSFFKNTATSMTSKGKEIFNNLKTGASNVFSNVKTWFKTKSSDIGQYFTNMVGTMKDKGKSIFNNLKSGASGIWSSVSSWFKTKATDISDSFKNKVSSMKTVGGDLIDGLKSGMKETGEKIKDTVENVAGKVTGWFKNVFGISSPSKVFAEMGMFLDLGLAKGINDHSDSAYDAAEGLGDDTAEGIEKSGLSKVLTDLNKSLESDFDNEVVIRPVLDLSEIQNGKNRLSNMMSDIDSYDISGSNSIANRTRDEINRDFAKLSNNSKDGSGQGVSNSEVINNTFHITGANAKDIADEVSRVLQIQVDRRKAKWAL